jgi:hypothetical protein
MFASFSVEGDLYVGKMAKVQIPMANYFTSLQASTSKSEEASLESFVLRKIAEKIKFNSLASCHSFLALSFCSGTAAAIIRSQCCVSRDSRLHTLMRYRDSFCDPDSDASA